MNLRSLAPPYTTQVWKAIGIGFGLLAVLGIFLFVTDKASNWWQGRKIDNLKANVNLAVQDLQKAQTNIAVEKAEEKVKLEAVNTATQELANATNATIEARTQTNQALQNMANAVNANHPIDITADQLAKQLQQLDK